MVKTPAGWIVYDVVVADVNLVTTYRETFNDKRHCARSIRIEAISGTRSAAG
ncbi:MAG: ABC transporter substrate-binding protein [Betaproteobacteria bacterium]